MSRILKLTQIVMWLCQLPSRFCFYVRSRKKFRVLLVLLLLFLYCEFVHYYLVLLWCTWPLLPDSGGTTPLRAMIIGDTHLLGSNAHWFDKLRREWQMRRSFQASMLIHNPNVVFVLGDLLDNGQDCSRSEFEGHVQRFWDMFHTPFNTRTEILVGNHDVGFHYRMSERKHERFVNAFASPSVRLVQLGGALFVLLNSMAMEGDGCSICQQAENQLHDIKWQLKCSKMKHEGGTLPASICDRLKTLPYSRPILLQHFPMYRESDSNCSTPDAAPPEEKDIPFREAMDCLSRESTHKLFDELDPRLVISAHTHHGCYRVHDNGVPEYTIASYNWRNKQTPSFLLAEIHGSDYVINRCYLPNELTVISIYVTGAFVIIVCLLLPTKQLKRCPSKEMIFSNKIH